MSKRTLSQVIRGQHAIDGDGFMGRAYRHEH